MNSDGRNLVRRVYTSLRISPGQRRITLATVVTLLRIAAIAPLMITIHFHAWGSAMCIFTGAACTDMLDGLLARLLDERTVLGACLDPIADKLLLLSCFVSLTYADASMLAVPRLFAIIVLLKELVQCIGALLVYVLSGHIEVRPTIWGKLSTLVQMIFIIWLFSCAYFHWFPEKTYYTMLGIILVLLLISFIQYARMGIRGIRASENK